MNECGIILCLATDCGKEKGNSLPWLSSSTLEEDHMSIAFVYYYR